MPARNSSQESTGAKNQDGAQSIHRTIAILRVVAKYNQTGANLSKIARNIDLPPSTTHRILSVLVEEGMACYDQLTKLYNLGIGLYLLGSEARQYQIRDLYRDSLERIAKKTMDTAFLVVKLGYDVLCIDRVVGSNEIKVLTFDVGGRRPLGVGAGSLAVLASLPDDEIQRIIHHNRRRYEVFKGFSPEELDKMIRFYRKNGYSVNSVTPHIISIGVCLQDKHGNQLGALSVSGISSKMEKERQKEIARLIQSEINWQGHQKSP
jgi:DNA-binding IclR family transcriptional regulator